MNLSSKPSCNHSILTQQSVPLQPHLSMQAAQAQALCSLLSSVDLGFRIQDSTWGQYFDEHWEDFINPALICICFLYLPFYPVQPPTRCGGPRSFCSLYSGHLNTCQTSSEMCIRGKSKTVMKDGFKHVQETAVGTCASSSSSSIWDFNIKIWDEWPQFI